MGSLDAEGYLSVSGRKDNMFVSGGENIHPEEIEKALGAFGDVEDVIVVPVPDEEFGQRPVAFLKMSGEKLSAEAWMLRLGRILPRFKIPEAFLAWPLDAEGQGLKPDRAYFRSVAALERQKGSPA
jgi:O-succinylbenzoic acid--CoA ligase